MSVVALQPVTRKSAEAQAAEILRAHILSGAAAPGARLTEMSLSEGLRLSRTTIRTALHQLAHEGLVVQVPYTGWEVMSLSAQDAWELYTLRSTLEGMAAELAAGALTREGKARLQAALKALIAAARGGDAIVVAERDFELHRAILDLAGHRRLREQYRLVEQQVRLYIASSNALIPDARAIAQQHRPIVEAILAGDGETAARLSREHNEVDGRALVSFLEEREKAHDEASR